MLVPSGRFMTGLARAPWIGMWDRRWKRGCVGANGQFVVIVLVVAVMVMENELTV